MSFSIQKVSNDIGRICRIVDDLELVIKVMRNDNTFDTQYAKVMRACELENILTEPQSRRRRRPAQFEMSQSQPGMQFPADRSDHADDNLSYKEVFKRDM